MDKEGDNWDFESMVTAKKTATTGIFDKLLLVQRVCEEGDKADPTTIVEVV